MYHSKCGVVSGACARNGFRITESTHVESRHAHSVQSCLRWPIRSHIQLDRTLVIVEAGEHLSLVVRRERVDTARDVGCPRTARTPKPSLDETRGGAPPDRQSGRARRTVLPRDYAVRMGETALRLGPHAPKV